MTKTPRPRARMRTAGGLLRFSARAGMALAGRAAQVDGAAPLAGQCRILSIWFANRGQVGTARCRADCARHDEGARRLRRRAHDQPGGPAWPLAHRHPRRPRSGSPEDPMRPGFIAAVGAGPDLRAIPGARIEAKRLSTARRASSARRPSRASRIPPLLPSSCPC
jgi:hypothetical protein